MTNSGQNNGRSPSYRRAISGCWFSRAYNSEVPERQTPMTNNGPLQVPDSRSVSVTVSLSRSVGETRRKSLRDPAPVRSVLHHGALFSASESLRCPRIPLPYEAAPDRGARHRSGSTRNLAAVFRLRGHASAALFVRPAKKRLPPPVSAANPDGDRRRVHFDVARRWAGHADCERRTRRGGVGSQGQVGYLKDTIRVRQLCCPLALRYSLLYQNVQSSNGSTDMEV